LKLTRILFAVLFAIYALYFILAPNTGTDYLFYYMPIAEYLFHHHSFPAYLSITDIDATFAYPPFEYILLSTAMYLRPWDGIIIKFFHIAKFALLFYLLCKIVSVYKLDGYKFSGFVVCQPMLYFLGVYNTDLNILLATASVVLLFHNDKWLWPSIILVTIALLSKYTFLILFFLILFVFFIKNKRREFFWLITPLFVYSLFLFKNFYYYGNPFYPIFAKSVLRNDISQGLIQNYFAWYGARLNFLQNMLQGIVTSLILVALAFFRAKRDFWLWIAGGCYVLVWCLLMNVDSAGQTSRFLMPVTLILFIGFSLPSFGDTRASKLGYTLIAGSAAMTIFMDKSIFVTSLPILLWGLLGIGLIYKKISESAIHRIILASVVLVVSARMVHKNSIDIMGEGYAYYQTYIDYIDKLSLKGKVLTDFRLIPYSLRTRPSVDIDGSAVFGNWDCIIQKTACKPYDFLFIHEENKNMTGYEDIKRSYYEMPDDFADYKLFRRRPELVNQ
jgi:hypothetical protein